MQHWAHEYVGRPWIEGVSDCADLVRDVVRDVRGIEVSLPAERDWRGMDPDDLADMATSIAAPVAENRAHDGDCVLMRVRGNKSSLGSHIGVAAFLGPPARPGLPPDLWRAAPAAPWVLHSMRGSGAVFVPVSALTRMHLELLGYYRWLI